MRQTLICGNWKMNGGLAFNQALLENLLSEVGKIRSLVAVCVPFPYLAQCQVTLNGSVIAWGAQDVSAHSVGAYTGEVSVGMLKDFSCRYAIVGHSERRLYHHETDELVAQKTLALLSAGITPIVCVGETLQEREAGETNKVVARQLQAVLSKLQVGQIAGIVVAYEPVWAIGTGKTATPQMAQEVHAFLRGEIARLDSRAAQSVQILYGGSMKPENAADLLAMSDIDGGLIGGAALKAEDFLAIATAATH